MGACARGLPYGVLAARALGAEAAGICNAGTAELGHAAGGGELS